MKTLEDFNVIELSQFELLVIRGGDGEGEGDPIIIPDEP